MSVKIKYGTNGFQEAEIFLDPKSIQNGKAREDYLAAHTFLTNVLGDCSAPIGKQGAPKTDDVQMPDEARPHNKSKPHYKADRKMAKFIIDAGGLKHLHGVNYIGKTQVFFFDKVPMIQAFVDLYNERNCADFGDSTKKARKKKGKKPDRKPEEAVPPAPEQTVNESHAEDVAECMMRSNEDTGGGAVD